MNRNALTNKQTNITYIKRILDLVTNIFSFNKYTVLVTKSRLLLEKKKHFCECMYFKKSPEECVYRDFCTWRYMVLLVIFFSFENLHRRQTITIKKNLCEGGHQPPKGCPPATVFCPSNDQVTLNYPPLTPPPSPNLQSPNEKPKRPPQNRFFLLQNVFRRAMKRICSDK